MSNQNDILNLVNSANHLAKPLTTDNVDVSAPAVDTDDNLASDTVVTLTPKTNSGYDGAVTVHYHRSSLADLPSGTSLASSVPITPDAVLAQINAQHNTNLVMAELVPFEVPAMDPNTSTTLTVSAAETSYGWTGSLQIELSYNP